MIKRYLGKVIALATITIVVLALKPIGASAEWKQDSNGWWNIEGSSYSVGWRLIDGKWYYFNSDGYMAHDTTVNGYSIGSDGVWVQNNTSNSVTNKSNTLDNTTQNLDLLDGNVSINYKINTADKIKGTNSNIIKATRQAIFDSACYFARQSDYNGYPVNNDIFIFDVKEKGTDNWEVDYYEKKSDEKEYDTIGYSSVNVEKQKDGSYVGNTTIH
jgi:hypothetical protein